MRVKVATIANPKITALPTPRLDSSCLAKYETVKGIMGKTHGVNKAAKPAKIAIQRKENIPSPLAVLEPVLASLI